MGRSAQSLIRLAESRGWRVRVTYARGTVLNGDRIVDSIAVRLSRPERYVLAMWLDGKYSGVDVTVFRSLSWQGMRDVVSSYPALGTTKSSRQRGTDIMPKIVEQKPEGALSLTPAARKRITVEWSQYVDGIGREFAGPKDGRPEDEVDFNGSSVTALANVRRWAKENGVTDGELKANHEQNTIYVRMVMPEGGLKASAGAEGTSQPETNPYA